MNYENFKELFVCALYLKRTRVVLHNIQTEWRLTEGTFFQARALLCCDCERFFYP